MHSKLLGCRLHGARDSALHRRVGCAGSSWSRALVAPGLGPTDKVEAADCVLNEIAPPRHPAKGFEKELIGDVSTELLPHGLQDVSAGFPPPARLAARSMLFS